MPRYTQYISNADMLAIVRRTFNHVDDRLIDHGSRVAALVARVLPLLGRFDPRQQRDICFLAALHDIGAYKTDEIDKMVQFETGDVWEHSIYGSLFLKYFSPFSALSDSVLLHHAPCLILDRVENVSSLCKLLGQVIFAADRLDIVMEHGATDREEIFSHLDALSGTVFHPQVIALFRAALPVLPLPGADASGDMLLSLLEAVPFSQSEIDELFKMLIFGIDFRSSHTVSHTVTTTTIAKELGLLLGMDNDAVEELVCGALLHDLGKIGIPVEILEFPGKLSPQAMSVMRTHVELTEDILDHSVDETVFRIAVRHHEKLDGSGYPLGLTGGELTTAERCVAVADIISALCGTRSYKEAYPREKVLSILREMSARGEIDAHIVDLACEHFDPIMERVKAEATPVLDKYFQVTAEYAAYLKALSMLK